MINTFVNRAVPQAACRSAPCGPRFSIRSGRNRDSGTWRVWDRTPLACRNAGRLCHSPPRRFLLPAVLWRFARRRPRYRDGTSGRPSRRWRSSRGPVPIPFPDNFNGKIDFVFIPLFDNDKTVSVIYL